MALAYREWKNIPTRFDFIERARYLLESYTVEEVLTLASDKGAMHKLSAFDGMVIMRLAESIAPGGGKAMHALLDRIIGRPMQTIAQRTEINVSKETLDAIKEIRELPREALMNIREIVNSESVTVIDNDANE